MSSSASFIRRCVAAGMPLEMALIAAEAFEAEAPLYVPPPSKEALRQRTYRAKIKAGRNVSRRDTTRDDATRPDATKRDDHDAARAPVHTRGENNLSRLVDIPNLTTLNASDAGEPDLDWPDSDKPSRAYLDKLQAALFEAGRPALNITAPKILSLAPILALGRGGQGPPCDLEADVLRTIRGRCARAPPASINSWDYLTKAICEARDRRLIGAPAIEAINQGPRHDRPAQSAKLAAKQANLERSFLAAQRVVARGAG